MKNKRRGFVISLSIAVVSLLVFFFSTLISATNSDFSSGDGPLGNPPNNSDIPLSDPESGGVDSSVMIAAISGITTICTTYITVRFNKKPADSEKKIVYVRVDENGKDIGEKANKD